MDTLPTAPRTILSISDLIETSRRADLRLFIVIFVTVVGLTPLLVLAGVIFGFGPLLGGLGLLIVAALIIRWPIIGFFGILGCVVLVEQNPLNIHDGTDLLNVYYWPANLAGAIERPIGFLFLFIFLVIICHNLLKRQKPLMGGVFLLPLLFFLLCVAVGVLHGLMSGGKLKIVILEIRPFWYLLLSYLLAYNLITHIKYIQIFFWIVILGAGVKAMQGAYVYLIVLHGKLTGLRDIMAHEESFFFVAILLLLVLFCLHHRYRPQFYAALFIVPPLLIALVANQRRTDYAAFLVGATVAWALIFCVKPHARKSLFIGMLIFLIIGAGYVAIFANSSGGIAEPARGVVSIFRPDPRDAASNLYRVLENFDLQFTAKQNPLIGFGFGKEFLQPLLLPDLTSGDPTFGGNPFLYVPHNTIYWVWMRLGLIGFFILWYLFGAIIVRGCMIARQTRDRYLQLVAIYIVAIIFIEVMVADADYQLFTYRNVIYIGLLMGILLKLPTLEEQKEALDNKPNLGVQHD